MKAAADDAEGLDTSTHSAPKRLFSDRRRSELDSFRVDGLSSLQFAVYDFREAPGVRKGAKCGLGEVARDEEDKEGGRMGGVEAKLLASSATRANRTLSRADRVLDSTMLLARSLCLPHAALDDDADGG